MLKDNDNTNLCRVLIELALSTPVAPETSCSSGIRTCTK